MTCERCQGDGLVITYDGKPLWIGTNLGRERIREIARGQHNAAMGHLVDVGSPDDRRRVLKLLRDCQGNLKAFLPVTCPDCSGRSAAV